MIGFLVRRLARTVFVLIGLTLAIFLLLQLSGDPATVLAPVGASQEELDRIREFHGLNRPMHEQYLTYVTNAMTGDLGTSWKYQRPALDLILSRMPATIELALTALLIALVVGGALGILGAARRGGSIDVIGVGFSIVGRAMPSFWLGLMLILFFAVMLGWLPTSGRGTPMHLVLPAITLAASFVADILLLTRAGMLEVLNEDYIRTGRAKGLGEGAIHLRHALPNALLAVVSSVGLIFARLIGGSVITETVFAWPGVGYLAVEGLSARDFPLVQASVIVLALAVAVTNLVTDLSYGFLDPRIRDG